MRKGAPRTFRSVFGSAVHKKVTRISHVVRVRAVRRCVENDNSGPDVVKLTATPSYFKPEGDVADVQERWTPTEGCKVCESTHGSKHVVRCEARRYEYRLKYGRKHRSLILEPERASEGAGPFPSVVNPVSARDKEQVATSHSTASASAPTVTHSRVLATLVVVGVLGTCQDSHLAGKRGASPGVTVAGCPRGPIGYGRGPRALYRGIMRSTYILVGLDTYVSNAVSAPCSSCTCGGRDVSSCALGIGSETCRNGQVTNNCMSPYFHCISPRGDARRSRNREGCRLRSLDS